MKPDDYLRNTKIDIWKGTFAVVKSKKPMPNSFAAISDKNEITCVIDQEKIREEDAIEIEGGWKILTFETVLSFELVGFLARVSKALAEEGISIFVISVYSTDHILMKEKDLQKAVNKLKGLGCMA